MQRELNFRVWCKDYNEWEKDYCFLSQNGVVHQMMKNGQIKAIRPESHVVQFFTGLFDKNSLPIYEGDIVKIKIDRSTFDCTKEEKVKLPVKFDPDFGFRACWGSSDCNKETLKRCSVIGNIFENPELLK